MQWQLRRWYPTDAVEDELDEVVDAALVAGVGFAGESVGDDHATGHSAVTHKACESCEGAGFHLEVGDLPAFIAEALDALVLVGVSEGKAYLAPLWTKESSAGDGDASHHLFAGDAVDEFGVGIDDVGGTEEGIPVEMFLEGFLEGEVTDFVAAGIEVEQAVEADALAGGDVGADGILGLQSSTGADSHEVEDAEIVLDGAGLEINVGEGVDLVEDDIDVVASDTSGNNGDALTVVPARYGVEFAALDVAFHAVEMGGHGLYSSGVSDEDDLVCQLFRTDVKVEYSAVFIDNEL